jgi:hypothetical protein
MPNVPDFQFIKKNNISDNAYEHSNFPIAGQNICRSRTYINQPVTGKNRRGRCEG